LLILFFTIQYNLQSSEAYIEAGKSLGFLVPKCDVLYRSSEMCDRGKNWLKIAWCDGCYRKNL